jgi:L-lysine 6-transaminase
MSNPGPFSAVKHPQPLSRSETGLISAEDVHDVLGRRLLVDGFDIVYDMKKSSGPYLYDARAKRKILDMFSFFASQPVTHNHPMLRDKDFMRQIGRIALYNPANSDIYSVEMAQFVATFERVAMPSHFKHAFFVAGGTLAVENAIKAACDYKIRKNLANGKVEVEQTVLHFQEAFHGRSGYTLSMTNTSDPKKYMYFPRFGSWPRIAPPKCVFPLEGNNLAAVVAAEGAALKQIEQHLAKPDANVACIVLEPVQGEGGDNHFRPEFWHGLRKLADQYDVLLVADEVQTGFGLSGKFWAYEHFGIVPDIVCFGKKAQVCGIIATSKIDQVKDNVFTVPSRINSTWGGNLVDMVRSRRYLEIIEKECLVQNSAVVGAHLLSLLHALASKYPTVISNVRGKGLLCAFDVASPAVSGAIRDKAYTNGLMILGCGTRTIRFRPVLDVTKGHVELACKILDQSIKQATAEASAKL